MHSYWKQQSLEKPLFPDIEWNKPERRDQAGRLGIIGGTSMGFFGVAEAYTHSLKTGAGSVRVLLPSALKATIPNIITDTVFGQSTSSGSLAKESYADTIALSNWSTGILLAGDTGKNSETASLYERFLLKTTTPVTITRDAIEATYSGLNEIIERPHTTFVASFAQTQKIFQHTYYPKMITFSMQLAQAVEALHKFTTTYPVTIVTLHQEHIIVAHDGLVTTYPWQNAMLIWKGTLGASIATYLLWNASQPLEACTEALRHC